MKVQIVLSKGNKVELGNRIKSTLSQALGTNVIITIR